jgi:hypothetical protein
MGLKVLPNPNKIIIKILKILCCLGQNKDELNLPTHYKLAQIIASGGETKMPKTHHLHVSRHVK